MLTRCFVHTLSTLCSDFYAINNCYRTSTQLHISVAISCARTSIEFYIYCMYVYEHVTETSIYGTCNTPVAIAHKLMPLNQIKCAQNTYTMTRANLNLPPL